MKNVLSCALAFLMLTGFSWGAKKEEVVTKKAEPSKAYYAQETAQSAKTADKKETAPDVKAGAGTVGITKALGTAEPGELKARVAALARVSRAIRALNEAKGKK